MRQIGSRFLLQKGLAGAYGEHNATKHHVVQLLCALDGRACKHRLMVKMDNSLPWDYHSTQIN